MHAAAQPSSRCEVLIGRTLALCAHPSIAWRTQPTRIRAVVLATYFTAGYLTVLAGLALFARPS